MGEQSTLSDIGDYKAALTLRDPPVGARAGADHIRAFPNYFKVRGQGSLGREAETVTRSTESRHGSAVVGQNDHPGLAREQIPGVRLLLVLEPIA